jgi:hypothetical protein
MRIVAELSDSDHPFGPYPLLHQAESPLARYIANR